MVALSLGLFLALASQAEAQGSNVSLEAMETLSSTMAAELESRRADQTSEAFEARSAEGSSGDLSARAMAPEPLEWQKPAFLAGLVTDVSIVAPGDVNDVVQDFVGQPVGMYVLFGFGANVEYRPTPVLGVVGTLMYLVAPPIAFSRETNGRDDTRLFWLHAFVPTIGARGYIGLTEEIDMILGAEVGPHFAEFEEHSGSVLGTVGRFGFQYEAPGVPSLRLLAFVRYAKIRDEEGFNINLSGAGGVGEVAFDLM